jgi:hypothetical protein
MNNIRLLFVLVLCAPLHAMAQGAPERPNWDSALAMETANVPDSHARVEELFSQLERGDLAGVNARLDTLIAGGSLPQPARDFVLFRFAVGLAEFGEVDPGLVQRLRSVKPAALVPHQERDTAGVPLFNPAAAAEGVYQLGLRRQARTQATEALAAPADAWLDAYLLGARSQRKGFADALVFANDETLAGILDVTLNRLPGEQELTPIAGLASVLLKDLAGLENVVRLGGGSEMAGVLEAAGRTLPSTDRMALLTFAVNGAPPTNASLAIAQLYPALATDAAATAMLFERLADPDLGAAAAMALATYGGTDARARLQQIARQESGIAASRAEAALELEPRSGRQP